MFLIKAEYNKIRDLKLRIWDFIFPKTKDQKPIHQREVYENLQYCNFNFGINFFGLQFAADGKFGSEYCGG